MNMHSPLPSNVPSLATKQRRKKKPARGLSAAVQKHLDKFMSLRANLDPIEIALRDFIVQNPGRTMKQYAVLTTVDYFRIQRFITKTYDGRALTAQGKIARAGLGRAPKWFFDLDPALQAKVPHDTAEAQRARYAFTPVPQTPEPQAADLLAAHTNLTAPIGNRYVSMQNEMALTQGNNKLDSISACIISIGAHIEALSEQLSQAIDLLQKVSSTQNKAQIAAPQPTPAPALPAPTPIVAPAPAAKAKRAKTAAQAKSATASMKAGQRLAASTTKNKP